MNVDELHEVRIHVSKRKEGFRVLSRVFIDGHEMVLPVERDVEVSLAAGAVTTVNLTILARSVSVVDESATSAAPAQQRDAT